MTCVRKMGLKVKKNIQQLAGWYLYLAWKLHTLASGYMLNLKFFLLHIHAAIATTTAHDAYGFLRLLVGFHVILSLTVPQTRLAGVKS